MNLVEIAKKYNNGEYKDKELLNKDILSINLFEPIKDDEETIYSIGDGNSLLEVNMLVSSGEMSIETYMDFVKLIKKIKN